MSAIRIRRAGLGDLDRITPLFAEYRVFYGKSSDEQAARSFIRDRLDRHESVVMLAEDHQGRAVGFCQLYPSFCSVEAGPIYVLYDLFVSPEFRRLGAAAALLVAAEVLGRATDAVRIDLSTAVTNQPAQKLYELLGWIRDEAFFTYNRFLA